MARIQRLVLLHTRLELYEYGCRITSGLKANLCDVGESMCKDVKDRNASTFNFVEFPLAMPRTL